ncbi:MAG: hypothetical protein PF692_08230 [Kiritimatiellae bacterium]|jgi:hypothetical protein|nr:hypothetical protein [Kiritimatiellia bacterium]
MKKIIMAIALILAIGTLSSQAATKRYWNGSVDNLYTNGSNWAGGNVPADNDYSDQIAFQDSKLSGVMSKTSTLTGGRKINAILFYDAGYSITGSTIITKYFNSAGSGTNYIYSLKSAQSTFSWNVGTGNTTVIDSLYQDGSNNTLTFQNGGTLILNDSIDNTWGTNYVKLNDILLIVRANRVHVRTASVTKLMLESSELQLNTTVSGAESLISAGTITENLGQGFTVTDIGGGYVSIKIAPPPPPVILGTVLIIE